MLLAAVTSLDITPPPGHPLGGYVARQKATSTGAHDPLTATLVWLAYEAPAIASSGQTLGKRLLGIKVVPVEKNEPLGFARAFARWGRLGIWNLFWWCGVGLIVQFVFALSPAFDPRLRQAWHDKAAATVVVDVPPGGTPPSTPSGGSR